MKGALAAVALGFYAVGALSALVALFVVARADTGLAHAETAAAPALELGRGAYEIRGVGNGSAAPRVFALGTRAPLAIAPSATSLSFAVSTPGVYVVELPAGASLHARERFIVSPTLLFVAVIVPLATVPGIALLDAAVPAPRRDVVLGRSMFPLASARRQLAAVLMDLVAIAVLLVFLVLLTPLLAPIAPIVPLAPLAYLWSGNARGRTIGRWLAGLRVVSERGEEPGWVRGLLRTLAGGLSWCLLGGGFLAAAAHRSKVAPHDVLAGTRVVCD